jgi:glycosyltransferase involved in cell wall biosynthesis
MTVLVLTLNEEVNIGRCLGSVGWASQVIVVDSGSTDRTVEIARRMGAEVVRRDFDDFASQRNWAMHHPSVNNDWVLFVDADHWVSEPLAVEIQQTVERGRFDAYAYRCRLIWQGRWIKYAGWYSGLWMTRLARCEIAHVEGKYSEQLAVPGAIGTFVNDIIDEDAKPFEAWLAKHNRYSTLRAEQVAALRSKPLSERLKSALGTQPRKRVGRELIKQMILPKLPLAPFGVFVYLYLLRGGFLMGRTGLEFCTLHAVQEMHVRIKVREMERAHGVRR